MAYFNAINEPCPTNKNPAEFFMTMMTEEREGATKEDTVANFSNKFNESELSSIDFSNERRILP